MADYVDAATLRGYVGQRVRITRREGVLSGVAQQYTPTPEAA